MFFGFRLNSRHIFPVSPLGRKPALSSTRWEARFPGSVYAWTSHSPGCREAQITMAFTSSQTDKLVFRLSALSSKPQDIVSTSNSD